MSVTTDPTFDLSSWRGLSGAASLASHRLIGWIFWDPWGTERYAELGVPDGACWYFAIRGAPLAAVNAEGIALRQVLEDRLDERCAPGWQAVGEDRTRPTWS